MASSEPHDRRLNRPAATPMLTVDEAREKILKAFSPLDAIDIPILDALARVAAEDVVALEDVPPFRNSAMDGYALRSDDVARASAQQPVRLRLIGDAAAGRASAQEVSPGTAIRIMTGAVLPRAADAVVRFEAVEVDPLPDLALGRGIAEQFITISRPASQWENVRHAGEDVARGAVVIKRGTPIGAAHIGLLAAINRSIISITRPPRVAILATGDEVVEIGAPAAEGQIRNSNSYMIAALTRRFGGESRLLGIARDSEDDIIDKLSASQDADLIVTTGGVSVGDFDVVKQVLRREGDVDLWQVNMKPGKPLAFGRIGGIPLLGLPGNPAAAFVAYTQFGRPAIRRMLGLPDMVFEYVQARLLRDVSNPGGRRHFVRAIVSRANGDLEVSPVAGTGSGALFSLTQANCLIVVPEETEHIVRGAKVTVQILDNEFRFQD